MIVKTAQNRMNTVFLSIAVALDTGLVLFMSARYFQENNHKWKSKTALLNDKFSRAVFVLVLFIFSPGDIILAFLAIVTSSGPVEFPFKIFVPGDLPRVKFLLAQ
jgi:membrane protein DedA with SNARE-associated domain